MILLSPASRRVTPERLDAGIALARAEGCTAAQTVLSDVLIDARIDAAVSGGVGFVGY
jgi:hypothetical protein